MRYLFARVEEQARVRGYRNYVTDCLKALLGGETRYADMFNLVVPQESAEDIKNRIKDKLRSADGSVQPVSETDT
jgi:hypothetical protein